MKILDAFTFYNELDILKIRLDLLYEKVDKFVICESNVTFSGHPKRYYFEDNKNEFLPYLDKILLLHYEPDISSLNFSNKDTEYNPFSAPWIVETGQRNFLSSALTTFDADDIAFVSDVDEIWNPELSDSIKSREIPFESARLEMQMHYYYLNCFSVGQNDFKWTRPFFSEIAQIKLNPDLNEIRIKAGLPIIKNSGWHFSYLGGAKKISEKINAFSHQETNTPDINNLTHLEQCINLGRDHLNRPGYGWAFRPVDYYPVPLREQMKKFPHLVRSSLI
jgi:beta-1,4-mannosyl-glycoprotein beta-1,4-N-acetylglucosaminyltransferase